VTDVPTRPKLVLRHGVSVVGCRACGALLFEIEHGEGPIRVDQPVLDRGLYFGTVDGPQVQRLARCAECGTSHERAFRMVMIPREELGEGPAQDFWDEPE
jgi:hypothetical protein